MSTNKGIITRPVSIADVQKTLGVTANDVGSLCTSDAINKWAKYKPVSRAKLIPLTEEERKGTGGTGEYYGLQCTLTQITISPEIHNVGFEYIRPTGGISSPYRLSDFEGYDHAATPDPTGVIRAREVYWQDELSSGSILQVYLHHYNWKGTGVSLDDIIGQLNGFGDIKENIHFCYPMIMLGDSVRCLQNSYKKQFNSVDPANYCTTLGELQTQSATGKSVTVDGRTVIIDGQVWWDRVESVKVNGIDRTGTIVTITGDSVNVEVTVYGFYDNWEVPIDILAHAALGTLKATVFLFYPKGSAANTFINNCKSGWVPYGNHGLGTGPSLGPGNVQTYRSFPIPEAVGIDIVVDKHDGARVIDVKLWMNNAGTAAVGVEITIAVPRPNADDNKVTPNTDYTVNGQAWIGTKPESGTFGGQFSVTVNSGDRMQAIPGLIEIAENRNSAKYSWAGKITGEKGNFGFFPPNNKSTLYYEWNCMMNGVQLESGTGSIYIGQFSGSL